MEVLMLTLLVRWAEAASQRRQIEQACGYPPEYGGDAEVLADTDIFLKALEITNGKKTS